MKARIMQSVAGGFCLSLVCVSALASPCYPTPQGQGAAGPHVDPAVNGGYPPPAQPDGSEQSAPQPCAPGVPAPEPSGNVITRAADAAKQQADAEVQFEVRSRVRHVFDRVFNRY